MENTQVFLQKEFIHHPCPIQVHRYQVWVGAEHVHGQMGWDGQRVKGKSILKENLNIFDLSQIFKITQILMSC